MIQKIPTGLLTLFISFAVHSQSVLTSKIVDNKDEPLIGASVLLKGTSKGSITDIEGKFSITNIPNGEYTLNISYFGFEEISKKISINGNMGLGEMSLLSATIGLEEIQVLADIVEERKAPVAISTISDQQLDERYSDISLADAMQNTSGVYTIQGAGGYAGSWRLWRSRSLHKGI